ncbi:MAG: NUDIX domain-containing protein [Defluviitaleaceae bacterium]|nr:NUDIX domain-containing protein [Defluviitaleaceae bacterium]
MGEIGVFTKAFIIFNKKMLIIKRSDYCNSGKGEWDIPGGGLIFGETPLECLHREVKEETGLAVSTDRLLYAASILHPHKQGIGLMYLCSTDSVEVNLSDEHTEYLWATKAQVIERITEKVLGDYTTNSVFEILDID